MVKKAVVAILICGIALYFFLHMHISSIIPLYDGVIPNSRITADKESFRYEGNILIVEKVSRPTLTIFLPPKNKATGTAVLICPGGGYSMVAAGHEGSDVARRLNEYGIAAFVLKYRIPDDSTMINKEIGPLQDAQRAMLIIRSRAAEWGIDPNRIGIMGFSAGGHLASTVGTHFEKNYIENPRHISLRPDFMILIYPVISFNERIGHMGSAHNLLGPKPSLEKIKQYSNELQVSDKTPPSFLVHAKDDSTVLYENSIVFADSLKAHHVHVELFLYDHGEHGFGLNNKMSNKDWVEVLLEWLGKEHFLSPKPKA